METLTKIARTEPQSAYAALTHGLIGKWLYAMRTIPGIAKLFTPLEEIIRNSFIPTITGRKAITDAERDLLALPCRLGGLGIPNPTKISNQHYDTSIEVTAPLVELILEQKFHYSEEIEFQQKKKESEEKKKRREQQKAEAQILNLPQSLSIAMELANEKGLSNWLTSKPIPMVSHFIKVLFVMHYVFVMVGYQTGYQSSVTVGKLSL